MRYLPSLVMSLIAAASLSACGSPAAETNTANVVAANTVPANGNSYVGNNSSTGSAPDAPIPGIPSSPGNVDINKNTPSAGNLAMNDRRKIVDTPQVGPTPPVPTIPAPENSTMATTMGRNGSFIEIRTFKSDPYIARIEKVYDGKNQTAKIYLKNGRVVSVAPQKIPQTSAISVAELMRLAGLKPVTPQATRPGTSDRKNHAP